MKPLDDTTLASLTIEVLDTVLLPATELPLPPRINTLYDPYKYTRNGKEHLGLRLSAEARGYKSTILPVINVALRGSRALLEELQRDKKRMIAMHSRCFLAENRTDVDAGCKALQDAIAEHLGIDDLRVIDHHLQKFIVRGCRPSVIVEVREARWHS